ncbi:MAG: ATP-binding protein [Candidatus Aminicenantes bacterium]|nr:ATP-binding protein [Candidatus Aminicenantes bacterium]
MKSRETKLFEGDLSGVEQARRFFKSIAARLGLTEDLAFQIELALVEVWTNIVRHAYSLKKGDFLVSSWTEDDRLYFEVRDDGSPFDPRDFKEPDLERRLNDGQRGGFGCFLTSRLMDGVAYRREDGKNILTLWKRIPLS